MTEPATTEAAAIADLATRATSAATIDPNQPGITYVVDTDGTPAILDVSYYRAHPRRATARRTVADIPSLLAYLQRHDPLPRQLDTSRHAPDGTPERPSDTVEYDPYARPVTLWADQDRHQVVAVLNDHQEDRPGWADHTATLQLSYDPDWLRWRRSSGTLMSQEEAAEFLEELLHTVVDPDAADLLEVVSSLQVHRQMVVGQMVNLRSGATQITYSDEDTVTAGRGGTVGTLEVPNRFRVRVPVYVGGPLVEFTARFRYRQQGRALKVAYLIDRKADVERGAFADVVAELTTTGRQVLFGSPGTP